jgi:pimeloyl-ACP methyl ester carboxylesterase
MKFTDVKGVRRFYKEYGDPKNNKHVLFIHGLTHPLVGGIFEMALSKHFHTITVGLISFGESDKPEIADDYTIKGFCKSFWISLKGLR